ncbi:hypothetical protein ACS8WL_004796, partial [Escherichia coli]
RSKVNALLAKHSFRHQSQNDTKSTNVMSTALDVVLSCIPLQRTGVSASTLWYHVRTIPTESSM